MSSLPDPAYIAAAQARRLALQPIAYPNATAVDHYDPDDGDATHPIFVDFILPAVAATIGKVTISWKNRAFRSTTNLNPSTVGTDASGESGHSHSHSHTIPIDAGPFSNAAGWDGGNFKAGAGGTSSAINSNAAGSSGHSHSHTHSLTGSGLQAVTDGLSSNVTNLSIDGRDYTTLLGGPWSGDVVELDITAIFPTRAGMWHTIALSLAGLGRVISMLRIYYV